MFRYLNLYVEREPTAKYINASEIIEEFESIVPF